MHLIKIITHDIFKMKYEELLKRGMKKNTEASFYLSKNYNIARKWMRSGEYALKSLLLNIKILKIQLLKVY